MAGPTERRLNRGQQQLLARWESLQSELSDLQSKLAQEGLLQPARASEADEGDALDYDSAVRDLIDHGEDQEFYESVSRRYGEEIDDWAMGDSDVDLIDHIESLDYQRISIPEARNQKEPVDPSRPIPSVELPEEPVMVSPYQTVERSYTFDWPREKKNDPGYQRSYLEIVQRKSEEGKEVVIAWR